MNSFLKYIFLLFLVSVLMACSSDDGNLVGHYYNDSFPNFNYVKKDFTKTNFEAGPQVSAESFIDFYQNGDYIMYINQLEYGKYKIKGDSVTLKNRKGFSWKLAFRVEEEKKLGHFTFPNENADRKTFTTFKKIPFSFTENYPFTKELNQWREVSETPLSKNELIDKVQNYIEFVKVYMIWSDKVEVPINVKDISGPIRFAKDGFMLRRLERTGDWCNYFAAGDCERMDQILFNHFEGLVVDWIDHENRLIVLLDGLDKLIKGLDHYRETDNPQI